MLLETSKKFENEVNELMKEFMKPRGLDIMEMDETEFALMKKCLTLVNTAIELTTEQANAIDKIDNKLDRLLAKN